MKKRSVLYGLILAVLIFSTAFPVNTVPAMPLLATTINLTGPSQCPPGGCAAGQRLNLRSSFDLSQYQPGLAANVQVCVFTPVDWNITDLSISPTGTLSGAAYTSETANCGSPPTNYQLSGGVSAALSGQFFGDSLDLAFRLGRNASTNGSVYIRVLENNGTAWSQSGQAFIFLPVAARAATVYAAASAEQCAENTPCYINSADDLAGGIGTGLKDAIDAVDQNSQIIVLGTYPIKRQTVAVNKTVAISGATNAILTYSGSGCDLAMLSMQAGGSLRNLIINDGTCTVNSRNLLQINSTLPLEITANTLTGGSDAITITQANAAILIQSNHIFQNSGYAINRQPASGSGALTATANNLYANRSGAQVTCANLGSVDHNFWGFGVTPAAAAPDCSSSAAKLLGSPILTSLNGSGVQSQRVSVTTTKTYYFDNQIAVSRGTGGSNYDLYIANHGNNASAVPFLESGGANSLVPCSNYFDVFLAQPVSSDAVLNLSLKYNSSNACIANVETTAYCGGTNAANFPLWWYDPTQLITAGWDTTGQNPAGSGAGGASGQNSTCNLTDKEITVQIDASGRPGINQDLNFTPFVVALIGQPAAAVLSSFTATPDNMRVTMNWSTSSELNTSGFYVQRRIQGSSEFTRVSPFLARTGTNTSGSTYSFADTSVINGTSYEYRLEISGSDLLSVYSHILPATPNPATPSPTPTVTPTVTITLTPTITTTTTITTTLTPTITTTITMTRTRTRTPTVTRTSVRINTRVPTAISTPTRTRTLFVTRTNFIPSTLFPSATPLPGSSGGGNPMQPGGGYPGPGSNDSGPDPGYPGSGSSNGSNQEPGFPDSDTANQTPIPPGTVFPGDETNADQTLLPGGSVTISVTATRASTAGGSQTQGGEGQFPWLYGILGGVIALCILLLAIYFLWKKGILALPF